MSARPFESRHLPLLALVTVLAGLASPALGQALPPPVVTDIVTDTAGGRDLGTVVSTNGAVHTIDGGTLAGANLFHSFASFSLAQTETAQWVQTTSDPTSIANVISRVTGGGTSFISGTLDSSAIPNADFWFVNPAGLVFGEGAQVNVPAAAHFSTAGSLRFADGQSFEIATPDGSTLSVAPPTAFGFLGGQGDIVFDQASVFLPGQLTLTAANVSVEDSTVVPGALTVAAVGSRASEVARDGSADADLTGTLAITASDFSTVATMVGDGHATVNAGLVSIADGGRLGSFTIDDLPGGDLTVSADSVELMNLGAIVASSTGSGPGGALQVAARDQIVSDGGVFQAQATADGNGGNILLTAPVIQLANTVVNALTFGSGSGGSLTVDATDFLLATSTSFFASSLGSGATGDINLHGGTVDFTGVFAGAEPPDVGDPVVQSTVGNLTIAAAGVLSIANSTLTTTTMGSGKAGSIDLSAASMLLDGITISADTVSFDPAAQPGSAGNVTLNSFGDLQFTNSSISAAASAVCSSACLAGNAGSISLIGSDIVVSDATLDSTVSGGGDAGSIAMDALGSIALSGSTVTAGSFTMGDLGGGSVGSISLSGQDISIAASRIATDTTDADGGFVQIFAADGLSVTDSGVSSDTFGTGAAGGVLMTGTSINILRSLLTSDTSGPGDAGAVAVNGDYVDVIDSVLSSSTSFTCFDNCSTAVPGNAGAIQLSANGNLTVANTSLISDAYADTAGQGGTSGLIALAGSNVSLTDSFVTSNSFAGQGGQISVFADERVDIAASTLSSSNFGSGSAGDVVVVGTDVALADTSLDTSVFGTGNAGLISVQATNALNVADGFITSDAFADNAGTGGFSGPISLFGDTVRLNNTFVTSSSFNGEGGSIFVSAGSTIDISDGALFSNVNGDGSAGDISLFGRDIFLSGVVIDTGVLGSGNAGSISLIADNQLRLISSSITSDAFSDANAGAGGFSGFIQLQGGGQVSLLASRISSNSGGGSGGAVSISGGGVDIAGSSIDSTNFGGDAGSVDVFGGSVSLFASGINTSVAANGTAGSITLTASGKLDVRGSNLNSDADAGNAGLILLFGDDTSVKDTTLTTSTFGGTGDSSGFIDIEGTNSLVVDNATISSDTGGDGDAGGVLLSGPRGAGSAPVTITGGTISSDSTGRGDAGVIIALGDTIIIDGSVLSSSASGLGDAGNIVFEADDRVEIINSTLKSDSAISGVAGAISIDAADIVLDGSTISSVAANGSKAGNTYGLVILENIKGDPIYNAANSVVLRNGSSIVTNTNGPGDGGDVVITTRLLDVSESSIRSQSVPCDTAGCSSGGPAGDIMINADSISLSGSDTQNLAEITTSTQTAGLAGNITMASLSGDPVALTLSGSSASIASQSSGAGNAGTIKLFLDSLTLEDGAQITTSTSQTATGKGGAIMIDLTGDLILRRGGEIVADTNFLCTTGDCGDKGQGGEIRITVGGDITLVGNQEFDTGTFIRANANEGGTARAGNVTVTALGDILLSDRAYISSDSLGNGDSGMIDVLARNIGLSDGSFISSDALGDLGSSVRATVTAGQALTLSGNAYISADVGGGGQGGDVFVSAGTVRITDASITANSSSTGDAGNVLIAATTTLDLDNGSIASDSFGTGNSGSVAVSAAAVTLANESFISSDSLGDGDAGSAMVKAAGLIDLAGGSYISSDAGGGNSGGVSITAAALRMRDFSYISSDVLSPDNFQGTADGNGGDVAIIVAGPIDLGSRSSISASTLLGTTGKSGTVTLSSGELLLAGASRINSDSKGEGDAGTVAIDVTGRLDLAGASFISSDAGGGNAGGVRIGAASLRMRDFSYISSDVFAPTNFIGALDGNGGNVRVTIVGSADLGSGSSITSNTLRGTTGRSGSVTVAASNLVLTSGAAIASDSRGEGDAQQVSVAAGNSLTLDGATISSDAGGGNAGGVQVSGATLTMRNGSALTSNVLAIAPVSDGSGGAVNVGFTGAVELEAASVIASNTRAGTTGNAGNVTVSGSSITLHDRSSISSDAFGAGNAFLVKVAAGSALTLDNASFISSDAGQGSGGQVQVGASALRLDRSSYISSDVFGANSRGNAGNVAVTAGQLRLDGASSITSDVLGFGALGLAGTVGVTVTGVLDVLALSNISSDTSPNTFGNANSVTVSAGTLNVSTAGSITSQAAGAGRSGSVNVAAGLLQMDQAGFISTGSVNQTTAGTIAVTAGNIVMNGVGPAAPANQTRITSSNTGTGDAGSIVIRQTATGINSGITMTEGALITTSSAKANAGSIMIDMGTGSILRLLGRTANALIDTSAPPGSSGGAVVIGGTSAPYAVILNGGSIRALGTITNKTLLSINTGFLIRSADRLNEVLIGQGEEVGLEFEDVSSGIITSSLEVIDASRVLSGACPAARATGQYSQLTKPIMGPYAVETATEPLPPTVTSSASGPELAGLSFDRSCL